MINVLCWMFKSTIKGMGELRNIAKTKVELWKKPMFFNFIVIFKMTLTTSNFLLFVN